MDHGLETHVHLAATDNLSHIGRVVGLEDGDLDAFLVEVALGLSEIQGDMVRRRLPFQRVLLATDLERPDQAKTVLPWSRTQTKKIQGCRTLPVGEKSDLVSSHDDGSDQREYLLFLDGQPKHKGANSPLPSRFFRLTFSSQGKQKTDRRTGKEVEGKRGETESTPRMSFR